MSNPNLKELTPEQLLDRIMYTQPPDYKMNIQDREDCRRELLARLAPQPASGPTQEELKQGPLECEPVTQSGVGGEPWRVDLQCPVCFEHFEVLKKALAYWCPYCGSGVLNQSIRDAISKPVASTKQPE